MAEHQYEYQELPLEGMGGMVVPVAVERTAQRTYIWVPVRTVCAQFRIDHATQQRKIKDPDGEYAEFSRMIPFLGDAGWRENVTLEFEGFAQWLANIQASRASAESRDFIRRYQRAVWVAAQALLLMPPGPALPGAYVPALPAARAETRAENGARQRGRPSAQQIVEERLAWVEESVVQLGETLQGGMAGATRVAACPHCGGALIVQVGTLRVVKGD